MNSIKHVPNAIPNTYLIILQIHSRATVLDYVVDTIIMGIRHMVIVFVVPVKNYLNDIFMINLYFVMIVHV